MKPHIIKIAQHDFRHWYGIDPTDEQVAKIFAQDADATKELESYRIGATSFDTFDRNLLPYLLCKWLNIKSRWPCNGDSDEYKNKFFREFASTAVAFDLKLAEGD